MLYMESHFSGKTALVTGAKGGIGPGLVKTPTAQGAHVFRGSGGWRFGTLPMPMPCPTADAMGGLDLVFNNAGIITRGSVLETSDADWARTLAINVEALFRFAARPSL